MGGEHSGEWQDTLSDIWEVESRTFPNPNGDLCDEQAVFDGLKCAADQLRAGTIRDHRDVSFHQDGAVLVDPGPYLPRGPESLEAYLARLDDVLANRPFTLLVNNFQEFSAKLCVKMRLFAQRLFQSLKTIPAGTVSSHVMLARYACSPFGVHKDPNSVFTFVIRGRKILWVWPFEVFADRTRQPFARHRQLNLYDFDYRPFRKDGTPLRGEPGNMLYWPSSYWHVGETLGDSVHISLHITFDVHAEPRGELVDLLQKLTEDSLTEDDWLAAYPIPDPRASGPLAPPDAIASALRELATTSDTLESSVNALWLARMSAQGFWTLAGPVSDPRLSEDDALQSVLRADATFPVYWLIDRSVVTMAAHGRVIRFPAHDWTGALLEAISGRRAFRIRDLVPHSAAQADMAGVVSKLVAIGALRSEQCSTSTS